MKLRTIADSARHSTSTTIFRWRRLNSPRVLYCGSRSKLNFFNYINELNTISRVARILSLAQSKVAQPKVALAQVPVRTLSLRAGNASWATARLTADRIANSEAVMILGCIPAPNKVRRDRVVISI